MVLLVPGVLLVVFFLQIFHNYLQVWQEVWPKGLWEKDKHDNFNRYCRYISISIYIYLYIQLMISTIFISIWYARCASSTCHATGSWTWWSSSGTDSPSTSLTLGETCFDFIWLGETWFDLVWLGLMWLDLVWLGLIGFDWVWLGLTGLSGKECRGAT